MTLDEQIVRKRLLERFSREEVVLNAMHRYNALLCDAREVGYGNSYSHNVCASLATIKTLLQ